MTLIRTSLLAAFGLLAAGSVTPASAGALDKAGIAVGDVEGLHHVTDRRQHYIDKRGGWARGRDYRDDRYYGYDDHRHHRKHYKKRAKRKYYKRGYSRGYDEGYYDGRRHSRFDRHRHRHHRHHYRRDYGFRGGVYFGDGYLNGPGFRFRY